MERAHVMELGQDFVDGHWDVSCFCGWTAETLWDDREDAVAEFYRHAQSDNAPSGAFVDDQPRPIGPKFSDRE